MVLRVVLKHKSKIKPSYEQGKCFSAQRQFLSPRMLQNRHVNMFFCVVSVPSLQQGKDRL